MEDQIINEILRFAAESPENRFPGRDKPYFSEPMVGIAEADDPIFTEYKTIIGSFHLTSQEVYEQTIGAEKGRAASVISWILPITDETRKSNRKEDRLPSREWAQTRSYGAKFNLSLSRHLVAYLAGLGYQAVVPLLAPAMRVFNDPQVGLTSSWSERHAAYAAGLGTFSFSRGFITERGIAVRCGSLVTDLVLAPSKRAGDDPWGNCLYYRDSRWGLCIQRFPVGAISPQGFDKIKCYRHAYGTVPQAVGKLYGVSETGCGLCQTKVPCESGIPPRKK